MYLFVFCGICFSSMKGFCVLWNFFVLWNLFVFYVLRNLYLYYVFLWFWGIYLYFIKVIFVLCNSFFFHWSYFLCLIKCNFFSRNLFFFCEIHICFRTGFFFFIHFFPVLSNLFGAFWNVLFLFASRATVKTWSLSFVLKPWAPAFNSLHLFLEAFHPVFISLLSHSTSPPNVMLSLYTSDAPWSSGNLFFYFFIFCFPKRVFSL